MKKYIKVLGLACMAGALAFMTSCKKNETSTSIRVGLAPVEEETDGERAYIDLLDNQLKWQDGDAIMVYNINTTDPGQSMMAYYTAVDGSEGLTYTNFTTEAPTLGETQDGGYFVYYPAYRRNATEYSDPVMGDITELGNRQIFTIEPIQHYFMGTHNGTDYDMATTDPDALAMAWHGDTEAQLNNFYLTNAFGTIKLGLEGSNKYVDHIEVINVVEEGEGGSLWGSASFNLAGVTYETVDNLKQALKDYRQYGTDNYAAEITRLLGPDNLAYMPEEGKGNKLTLDCSDYMPQLEWTGATKYFYIAVRPGAFLKGVQFKIYVSNYDETGFTPAGYYLIDDFNMLDPNYVAPTGNSNVYPFLVIPNIMKNYKVNLNGRTLIVE